MDGFDDDLISLNNSKDKISQDFINETNQDFSKQADNTFVEEGIVEENNSSTIRGIFFIISLQIKIEVLYL